MINIDMKIALCLSGQPKSLEEGFVYHRRNLLDVHDVDVFCHAWNSHLNDKILELYNPVDYTFQNYKFSPKYDEIYAHCANTFNHPVRHPISQSYAIQQSRDLKIKKEQLDQFQYDWVVRSRYDFALNLVFEFKNLDPNKIYISLGNITHENGSNKSGFCDLFTFGSSPNMDKVMSVFDYFDEWSRQPGYRFYGEQFLSSILMKFGFCSDISYPIVGEQKIVYMDMNDPFHIPLDDGYIWHSSYIHEKNGGRAFWLDHEINFWNSQNLE